MAEIIENYGGKGRVTYRGKYACGNQWEFSVASLLYTSNPLDIITPSRFYSKDSTFLGPTVHPSFGITFLRENWIRQTWFFDIDLMLIQNFLRV